MAENDVRHPEITVELVGRDGNAFNVLGLVTREMRRAGVPAEERAQFMREATGGDYDHLLATVQQWVEVR